MPRLQTKTLVLMAFMVSTEGIYQSSAAGESPPNYCTVFHHMVKSAGSTIKHLMTRASIVDGVSKPAVCASSRCQASECIDGIKSSAVIAGYAELIRQPLRTSGRQCEFFTMMREPVSRLVSAFFYCPTDHDVQNRPSKFCGYHESDIPVTERLLEFAQTRWGSQAFRQMSFGVYCPPNALCETSPVTPSLSLSGAEGLQLLTQVKDLLATYTAVGIVEHYDLSMQLFDARVRSPVRDWSSSKNPVNSGQASQLRDEVLQWAQKSSQIASVLEADLLLYSHALDIFKRQTAETLGITWAG